MGWQHPVLAFMTTWMITFEPWVSTPPESDKGHGMVKLVGPPEYYLGNDFKQDSKYCWYIGCKKCIDENKLHTERMFRPLTKCDAPMVAGDHPKLDKYALLNNLNHQKYQMSIGILN
eukprot:813481-Ditylum_brightwellii.AAC.1